MIQAINLSYEVNNKKICNNVNLNIDKDIITGIVGPNGSGKSTFLKQIYGTLEPTKGQVLLNGVDIENYGAKELARKIGVMAQENSLEFTFTVGEIVLMGRSPYLEFYSSYSLKDFELAREALMKVGLLDKINQNYRTLSGGEKQRVLLARLLTQNTPILILDEPTNHLDIGYQYKVLDIIKNLEKTTIVAIHDLNFAIKYCDEIILFDKGRVLKKGKAKDVFTCEILREIFGIECKLIYERNALKGINILGACQ